MPLCKGGFSVQKGSAFIKWGLIARFCLCLYNNVMMQEHVMSKGIVDEGVFIQKRPQMWHDTLGWAATDSKL
eukprot:5328255-Amphidinium_carterae.1